MGFIQSTILLIYDLLESTDLTQIILGNLLINNKVKKQETSLQPVQKQSIKQFLRQCFLRINIRGVQEKLAESIAILSKQQILTDWKSYFQNLVEEMKNGTSFVCYGLFTLGNVPALLKDKFKIGRYQEQIINLLYSTLSLDQKSVFDETLNVLMAWTKCGLDILSQNNIISILLDRGLESNLENTLRILQSSIIYIYQKNQSSPIDQTNIQNHTKNSIQQIITAILSRSNLILIPDIGFIFSQISLSILSKIQWIYNTFFQDIFRFSFLVLQQQDNRFSLLAINYFLEFQYLKVTNSILSQVYRKCLEIFILKCQINDINDSDLMDYRYHSRQLAAAIFSKFYQRHMHEDCNHILIIINNSLNSQNYLYKQLGIFLSLSINESLKYIKDLSAKQYFMNQIFNFCFTFSSSKVPEQDIKLFELCVSIQINCLKLLSLNADQIIQMELQNKTVEACIAKLTNSSSKIIQNVVNLISLIISSIQVLRPDNTVLFNLMINLFKNRELVSEDLLEILISSFIEYIQKIPNCYPLITQILNQQVEYFKETRSMKCLHYIVKSIEKTSSTQLESVFHSIKLLLNQYIQSISQQQVLDQISLIGCVNILHDHSYPPFQQIDNIILENIIKVVISNPQQRWRLLKIFRQNIILLNFKENQMQTQPFQSWLKTHYQTINSLLISFVPNINQQSYYQLLFQIQDQILSHSFQLYTSSSQYFQIFKYASILFKSSSNPFLLKSILHFYQSFLLVNPDNQFHFDLLKSILSGLSNCSSSNYLSYFKILQNILKYQQPDAVGTILKEHFVEVLAGRQIDENTIDYLIILILKSISMNKSTYFKSILIDISNYQKRVVCYQEFTQTIKMFRSRFNI